MIKNNKAKRISRGVYEYRGYRLTNYGYYEPDHCIWWEAVDLKTGCAEFHEHTKRELIETINEELDRKEKK